MNSVRNRIIAPIVAAIFVALLQTSFAQAQLVPDVRTACDRMQMPESSGRHEPRLIDGTRPRASALFSFPDDDVREGALAGVDNALALVYASGEGSPILLATLQRPILAQTALQLTWYPVGLESRERRAEVQLGGLEHLYAFILRQDQALRYDFFLGGSGHLVAKRRTAFELLGIVTALRKCAAHQLASAGGRAVVPWETATLTPVPFQGRKRRQVAMAVKDGNARPIAHVSVVFVRGEDLTCQAWTDAKGVARCTLLDLDPHDDHGADEGRLLTYMNFAGRVTPASITPPASLVVP